ncbi:MAG: chemotaxis protein CheW [Anaerolineae bacterium]
MSNNAQQPINFQTIWNSLEWHDDTQLVTIQQRLKQRAQLYAAPLKERATLEDVENILAFQLGEERYGVDVMLVRAVRPVARITRVPATPPFYRGVINIRGQIITVLDLRLFLEINVNDSTPPQELVIVRAIGLEIGLLAHHISGVTSLRHSDIQSPGDTRFARGVTSDRLVLLNIGQIFESERLIIGGAEEA